MSASLTERECPDPEGYISTTLAVIQVRVIFSVIRTARTLDRALPLKYMVEHIQRGTAYKYWTADDGPRNEKRNKKGGAATL